jgi:hypothetical protein
MPLAEWVIIEGRLLRNFDTEDTRMVATVQKGEGGWLWVVTGYLDKKHPQLHEEGIAHSARQAMRAAVTSVKNAIATRDTVSA